MPVGSLEFWYGSSHRLRGPTQIKLTVRHRVFVISSEVQDNYERKIQYLLRFVNLAEAQGLTALYYSGDSYETCD